MKISDTERQLVVVFIFGHGITTLMMMPGDADAAYDRKDDAADCHRDFPSMIRFVFNVIKRAVQQFDDFNSIV